MPANRNPECYHLSASSISAFKKCPQLFRLAYREGLREDEDTDALRIGTNWHALHEVYRNTLTGWSHDEIGTREQAETAALAAVHDHLETAYYEKPAYKERHEWDLEKHVLMTCFLGYLWYYQDDDIIYLSQELPFDLPLIDPKVGLPLPKREVLRVGKIDHVVAWQGMIGPIERKSTTRDIQPGADYWDRSRKDTQVSMYALALRDMAALGLLPDTITESTAYDADRLGSTLYDVWRRPLTKPKALSQKDTAEFLTSGTYFEQEFEIVVEYPDPQKPGEGVPTRFTVDGVEAEIEPNAKRDKYAIRETIGMFCSRLLDDIYTDPGKYFQRKEIARTGRDLRKFKGTLWSIYQNMKLVSKKGFWYENEDQCRATFPCRYIPICYGPGADAVCDGETTPSGFRRIFVDPTVEGRILEGE